jgi:hypothetical protein
MRKRLCHTGGHHQQAYAHHKLPRSWCLLILVSTATTGQEEIVLEAKARADDCSSLDLVH